MVASGRLRAIQDQVRRREYQVDPQAVADAIVRRLLAEHKVVGAAHKRAQGECS
jgi:hypothetical protein